jgi:hypothetical protein
MVGYDAKNRAESPVRNIHNNGGKIEGRRLLLPAAAQLLAFPSGGARFFAAPFVGNTLLMRGTSAAAGHLPATLRVHRGKSACALAGALLFFA